MKKKTIFNFIFQFKTYNLSFDYLKIYKQFVIQFMFKKNIFAVKFVKILNFLNFLKSLHFLFLAYYPLSDFQRFLNFDGAYYLINNSMFSLMFAFCQNIIIIYGNKILLTDANINLIEFLENIIIKKDGSYFNWPTYKQKNICKIIQRNFMIYLNLFQTGSALTGNTIRKTY